METFDLRGKVVADENGKYSFSTVIPGHYSLNGDDQPPYRPEHIHAVVSAPGDKYGAVQAGDRYQIAVDKGNKFNVLVTQLYFKNDGDVDQKEQADDPFFTENEGEERAVQLERTPVNGFVDARGTLDFTLARVPSRRFDTTAG
jgi:protocatechuate 3,4-dioxygenase beta subunit